MNTKQNLKQPRARIFLLILALIPAVFLVACGGDEAPPEDVPAAATAAEETTEEPTVEAPTDEPVEEPTTAPPTAAPTEAPTAEPIATSGECGNAFYPVVEGRVMTYSTSIPNTDPEEHRTIYSNVTDSSFTVTTAVGEDEFFTTDWQCSADGLLSPEFSQLPGETADLTIEFVEASGVTIPSEDQFRVGESWTTHYVANATMGISETESMTMVQTIDMTNSVTGVEAISIPLGDFPEAVVVETAATISVAMLLDGTAQPATSIDMNYTSWYVEGVGMVRQEIPELFGAGSDGTIVTDLVSILQAE